MSKMKSYVAIAIFMVGYIISVYPAFADTIHLTNGNSLEGVVVEENEESVKVKLKIGTMTFTLDQIESIEKSGKEERERMLADWEKKTDPVSSTEPKPEQKAPSKIKWYTSLPKGLSRANELDKRVMVDFFADWCGWCHKLDKDTFSSKNVRALSTEFVCVKVDADNNRELVQKYKVTGYPTILFLDPSGKEAGRIGGYLGADEYAAQMKKYVK